MDDFEAFFQPKDSIDEIYRLYRDGNSEPVVRGRHYIEQLWKECASFVDPDARKRAVRDVYPVFWELQLAHSLIHAGKHLVPRRELQYRNNAGPDFFARDPNVWIEATAVRSGVGPDALQEAELGKIYDHDYDGLILRLRSAVEEKARKIRTYVERGIIRSSDATVIAISTAALPNRYRFTCGLPPEIVRSVYPTGDPVLEISRDTLTIVDRYFAYRDAVKKKIGADVSTDIFLQPEFAHISAVLCSESDWVNRSDPPGADFTVVHNHSANVPLPDGWWSLGIEYWWRPGGRIEHISHEHISG